MFGIIDVLKNVFRNYFNFFVVVGLVLFVLGFVLLVKGWPNIWSILFGLLFFGCGIIILFYLYQIHTAVTLISDEYDEYDDDE
jgi:protein-S-isoprenylcysteine O-methyltransferase Ste14